LRCGLSSVEVLRDRGDRGRGCTRAPCWRGCRAPGHWGAEPATRAQRHSPLWQANPPRGLRLEVWSVQCRGALRQGRPRPRLHAGSVSAQVSRARPRGACRTRHSSSAPQPPVQANPPRGLRLEVWSVQCQGAPRQGRPRPRLHAGTVSARVLRARRLGCRTRHSSSAPQPPCGKPTHLEA